LPKSSQYLAERGLGPSACSAFRFLTVSEWQFFPKKTNKISLLEGKKQATPSFPTHLVVFWSTGALERVFSLSQFVRGIAVSCPIV
jgi:hypothetical protein